jgi:SagB-type dehydrogenase family enzyme
MKLKISIVLLALLSALTLSACGSIVASGSQAINDSLTQTEESLLSFILPEPKTDGEMSVEQALDNRRSQRNFQDKAITQEQLSQILWAAYGITSPNGLRTAPSAGATYPLEIYAIVGNVEGINPGVYRYIAEENKIIQIVDGDVRTELRNAALNQQMVSDAPASVFYSAVFERITGRYDDRGIKYAYIEVGHSAQNVYLQAEALGLGTCAIGAFTDSRVREILNLPDNEEPLYLMPFGYVVGS